MTDVHLFQGSGTQTSPLTPIPCVPLNPRNRQDEPHSLPSHASLAELLVFSLKSPEFGYVNYRALFILLDYLIGRLGIGREQVDLHAIRTKDANSSEYENLQGFALPTATQADGQQGPLFSSAQSHIAANGQLPANVSGMPGGIQDGVTGSYAQADIPLLVTPLSDKDRLANLEHIVARIAHVTGGLGRPVSNSPQPPLSTANVENGLAHTDPQTGAPYHPASSSPEGHVVHSSNTIGHHKSAKSHRKDGAHHGKSHKKGHGPHDSHKSGLHAQQAIEPINFPNINENPELFSGVEEKEKEAQNSHATTIAAKLKMADDSMNILKSNALDPENQSPVAIAERLAAASNIMHVTLDSLNSLLSDINDIKNTQEAIKSKLNMGTSTQNETSTNGHAVANVLDNGVNPVSWAKLLEEHGDQAFVTWPALRSIFAPAGSDGNTSGTGGETTRHEKDRPVERTENIQVSVASGSAQEQGTQEPVTDNSQSPTDAAVAVEIQVPAADGLTTATNDISASPTNAADATAPTDLRNISHLTNAHDEQHPSASRQVLEEHDQSEDHRAEQHLQQSRHVSRSRRKHGHKRDARHQHAGFGHETEYQGRISPSSPNERSANEATDRANAGHHDDNRHGKRNRHQHHTTDEDPSRDHGINADVIQQLRELAKLLTSSPRFEARLSRMEGSLGGLMNRKEYHRMSETLRRDIDQLVQGGEAADQAHPHHRLAHRTLLRKHHQDHHQSRTPVRQHHNDHPHDLSKSPQHLHEDDKAHSHHKMHHGSDPAHSHPTEHNESERQTPNSLGSERGKTHHTHSQTNVDDTHMGTFEYEEGSIPDRLFQLTEALEAHKEQMDQMNFQINTLHSELAILNVKVKEQSTRAPLAISRPLIHPLPISQRTDTNNENAVGPSRTEFSIFSRACAENFEMIEVRLNELTEMLDRLSDKLDAVQAFANRLQREKVDFELVNHSLSTKVDVSKMSSKADKAKMDELANSVQNEFLKLNGVLYEQNDHIRSCVQQIEQQVTEHLAANATGDGAQSERCRDLVVRPKPCSPVNLQSDGAAGSKRIGVGFRCVSCDRPVDPTPIEKPAGWPHAYLTLAIKPHFQFAREKKSRSAGCRKGELQYQSHVFERQLQRYVREQECIEYKQTDGHFNAIDYPHCQHGMKRPVGQTTIPIGARIKAKKALENYMTSKCLAMQYPKGLKSMSYEAAGVSSVNSTSTAMQRPPTADVFKDVSDLKPGIQYRSPDT